MALIDLVEKQIASLFSTAGLGGVSVVSDATLHLRQQGSFDPATGTISNGSFYDTTAGTFTGSSEPTIKVIQREEKDYSKTALGSVTSQIEGTDGTVKLLTQPLTNIMPSQLVGVRLDYNSRTFGIFHVNVTRLGNQQLVWELLCQ